MTENQLYSEEIKQRCRDAEENLKVIREKVANAAVRSGRNPEDITLLAATKTVPVEVINHTIACGLDHIGENKVQELCSKFDSLKLDNCRCEFIGHLQTNKVKQLIGKVSRIQSVDSLKLANEISKLSEKAGSPMDILVEVNIGGEENKSGVAPDELEDLLIEIAQLKFVNIKGLMTIPPILPDIAEIKQIFTKMFQLFIDMKTKNIDNVNMDFLSMGMSADFEAAIESGANIVRVGSSIFGKRIYN